MTELRNRSVAYIVPAYIAPPSFRNSSQIQYVIVSNRWTGGALGYRRGGGSGCDGSSAVGNGEEGGAADCRVSAESPGGAASSSVPGR